MAVPNVDNMTLSQALSTLQSAGYSVNSVSYAYQPIPSSEYSQYGNYPVYSYTPGANNTVAIGLNTPAGGTGQNSSTTSNSGTSSTSSTSSSGSNQSGTTSSTTSSSPATSTGGTTSVIPGWSAAPAQYDTSEANTGTSNGNVATGTATAQTQQAAQATAMRQLQSFFGTGSGYAPQFNTPAQQNTSGQAQQVTSGSASGTQATPASQSSSGTAANPT